MLTRVNRNSPTNQIDRAAGLSSSSATLAGIGAIALWCASGVCHAVGSRAALAMPYLSLTSAIGVLTIMLLRIIRGGSVVELFRVPPRVAVAGLFGIVIYSIMLVQAMAWADQRDLAHIMLLNYLWPIWIILLGMGMMDAHARPTFVLIGTVLGFAGVAVSRGSDLLHRPANWLPHLLAFIAGFLWALYSVLLRRWNIPAERGGSTFQFTILAAVAATIAGIRGQWHLANLLHARSAAWLLFAGIGPVGLGYFWWEIAIKRGAAHLVTLLAYFIPIGSAALIGLVYHQAMNPMLLPGAAMIAVGALIGHMAEAKRAAVTGASCP